MRLLQEKVPAQSCPGQSAAFAAKEAVILSNIHRLEVY